MKKKNPFKKNKYEIRYHLINSALAGVLVILGSCIDGDITKESISIAFIASLVVFLTKFKEYWDGQQGEYSRKIFNFIG